MHRCKETVQGSRCVSQSNLMTLVCRLRPTFTCLQLALPAVLVSRATWGEGGGSRKMVYSALGGRGPGAQLR